MQNFDFPANLTNDPSKAGQLAAPKRTFGPSRRYAVAPVHTRFDAIEWFVWDANRYADRAGNPDVTAQEATLDLAVAAGLIAGAQADLRRKLADGERRDLLCDNTNWTRERINAAVAALSTKANA